MFLFDTVVVVTYLTKDTVLFIKYILNYKLEKL